MLAALMSLLLLSWIPMAPAVDDLPRSSLSERELAKCTKDVQSYFEALDQDDRKEKYASLESITSTMEKAAKRAKIDDFLAFPGDWEYLLGIAKPVDREIKSKVGRGFFAYVFSDKWSETGTACLLSIPKTYGKADGFLGAIVALRPPLGLSGDELIAKATEDASAMYGDLVESMIIVIPLGPDPGGRTPLPSEMAESWASVEGTTVMFTSMRVLLERMQFDRSRVVLDGWGDAGIDAMRIATSYPSWFAGVIDRGGEVGGEQMILENLTGVPVLYVDAEAAGRDVDLDALRARLSPVTSLTVVKQEGEPTVPSPEAAASIATWAMERQRDLAPRKIQFKIADYRFQNINWIKATEINRRANANPDDKDFPRIEAGVDRATNRITMQTVNVTELAVYLSDALLDLDKPVVIEVNGKEMVNKTFTRSLQQLLDNRYYNNSCDFGLYPANVLVEDIDANVPGKTP